MIKRNQRKLGIILQYGQMGLSIIISFVYTPIMLNILGKSEYGIYNLANSIISYLSLFSLGFGASYIRFYSRYKKENDENSIKKLNGLFLLIFIVIGIIVFFCGMLLSRNVSLFFNETYSAADKEIARILMIFMSFNLALTFPMSVFTSYITAQEQFVFQKILTMVRVVVGPFLTLPALLMGWGSIGMVAVTTVIGLAVDIANVTFCLSYLKMGFVFKNPNFGLIKEIATFSIFIAINQLIDQINWQTDKVVLGKVCSSTAVAFYSIGAQINSYFTHFSTAISSVFTPEIHRIENSNINIREINKAHTKLMVKVGRIQFMLLALILSGFVFFGKYFIFRWAGKDYSSSYYVALLLMTPAIVPLIQNVGIEIQRAKNKHQFRSIVYLIMAAVNVGISIIFAHWWGEIGAALGTTISIILANGVVMNIFYHKAMGLNMFCFWKAIIKLFPALILPVIFGIAMDYWYTFKGLIDFGLLVIIYVSIYIVSMYFGGMNRKEKELVLKPIKRVMQR